MALLDFQKASVEQRLSALDEIVSHIPVLDGRSSFLSWQIMEWGDVAEKLRVWIESGAVGENPLQPPCSLTDAEAVLAGLNRRLEAHKRALRRVIELAQAETGVEAPDVAALREAAQ